MRVEGIIASTASATQQVPPKPPEVEADKATAERTTIAAAAQTKTEEKAIGDKLLNQAIEQANDVLSAFDEVLNIKVHKETKQFIIKLINQQTGEVIREYPPEKFLDMMANFQKQIKGLFVDTEQ